MTAPTSPDPLLEHASALRALARALVRGGDDPEDLVQRTWLIALRRPPAGPLRAWLARVLRNEARRAARADRRRQRRERAAARPEAQPSAADVVCRLALHRRLVEGVAALPPLEREAVCLRYFDGLPPRAIAARLGVPVRNVEARLRRGLERLRAALDADPARHRWLGALAACARPAHPTPFVATAGALLVQTKIVWATAAVTLSLVALWALLREPPGRVPIAAPAPRAERVSPAENAATAPAGARSAVAAPVAEATEARSSGSPHVPAMHGLVLDAAAAPCAGVPLVFRPDARFPAAAPERAAIAVADAEGRFAISPWPGHGELHAGGAGWATLLALDCTRSEAESKIVVVAPARALAGGVVRAGEEATPIAGAEVEMHPPEGLRARFALSLAASVDVERRTRSDANGAFAFEAAPRLAGCRIRVEAPGYAPADVSVPADDDAPLRIALQPLDAEAIEGVVLDPEGRAVAGATVALDRKITRTGEAGDFRFVVPAGAASESLIAVAPGYLPATLERAAQPQARWPQHVELRLPGPPLSIEGRVLDADGRPHAHARVWIDDPTIIGVQESGFPSSAEHVITPGELVWRQFATDADGRFSIPGLLDRVYELRAIDLDTLQLAQGRARAGARGVELQLAPDGVADVVRGSVVDRHGHALAGISISVERFAFVYRAAADGEGWACQERLPRVFQTDERGAFELGRLARRDLHLYLSGDGVLARDYTFPGGETRSPIEIVMARPCQIRIDLSGSAFADATAVTLHDARGERLEVRRHGGQTVWIEPRVTLVDGRGEVVTVSDAVATAVVLRAESEVARLPVAPAANGVTIVRP